MPPRKSRPVIKTVHTPHSHSDRGPILVHNITCDHYHLKSFHISPGFCQIFRRQYHKTAANLHNIYPDFWVLYMSDIPPGEKTVMRYNRSVYTGTKKYAFFVPANALVEFSLREGWSEWTGYTSTHLFEVEHLKTPFGFQIPEIPDFKAHNEMMNFINKYMPTGLKKVASPPANIPQKHYENVREYLNAHFHTDISMKNVSDALDLSPSTMTHGFKKAYGISPIEYVHLLRAFGVLSKISDGKEATKLVQSSGYNDYSNLYRQFVKKIGVPPSAYARRGFLNANPDFNLKTIPE